jgi:hypothetical protein
MCCFNGFLLPCEFAVFPACHHRSVKHLSALMRGVRRSEHFRYAFPQRQAFLFFLPRPMLSKPLFHEVRKGLRAEG